MPKNFMPPHQLVMDTLEKLDLNDCAENRDIPFDLERWLYKPNNIKNPEKHSSQSIEGVSWILHDQDEAGGCHL